MFTQCSINLYDQIILSKQWTENYTIKANWQFESVFIKPIQLDDRTYSPNLTDNNLVNDIYNVTKLLPNPKRQTQAFHIYLLCLISLCFSLSDEMLENLARKGFEIRHSSKGDIQWRCRSSLQLLCEYFI